MFPFSTLISCMTDLYCCYYFLQQHCNALVELFTKVDMSKYHIIIQDLISEVTFKKVESILQVGQDFFNLSGDLMCHK